MRLDTEIWARIVGTVAGIAVGAALVSSRTIPFTTPAVAIAMLASLWSQGRLHSFQTKAGAPEYIAVGFLGYAALSALWAFKPSGSVAPLVTGFGFLGGYVFAASFVRGEPKRAAGRLAEGLCLGLVFGTCYLGFEIVTDQSLKLAIYRGLHLPKAWLRPTRDFVWANGELIGIAASDLKRNIAPLVLLVWSALLAIRIFFAGSIQRAVPALLFAAVAFVILTSDHETSKAALIWSSAIFLLAKFSAQASRRALQVAWVVACLAVVPVALTAHHLDLHNARWVQDSFRHRIIIWNHTAEETLKRPVFGIGAGMMYQIDPAGERREADEDFSRIAPHAHNVYLQTWFELGAVGALLLVAFGLALIDRMRHLPAPVVAYAYATFASFMVMVASSYGMWEAWFISMFVMTAVMFAAAARAVDEETGTEPQSVPSPVPVPSPPPDVAVS